MIRAIGKKITPAISVPFRKQSSATAIHVEPTKADRIIADVAARTTEPWLQKLARGLAWGADEKVWLALTSVAWLVTRGQSSRVRATTTHALLVTVAASALPHALKAIFDQTGRIAPPCAAISTAWRRPAMHRTPFPRDMRCTWVRSTPPPVRCRHAQGLR
ncbi:MULTISPECIES: hypothetical protein [unclassified Bradyrhizobium]|uniref:hypothetical protein n=1 Tax=unclassified Bradyrhizobium TaxID=2631580 RepID=UPI0028E1EB86|nr:MULTISPECIES: hypothetical protein [unclassified Bradyrhizobium]